MENKGLVDLRTMTNTNKSLWSLPTMNKEQQNKG